MFNSTLLNLLIVLANWVSPVALEIKNLPANEGDIRDMGLIPGLGRSPGRGNGKLLLYSYLEKSMGKGAWQAI